MFEIIQVIFATVSMLVIFFFPFLTIPLFILGGIGIMKVSEDEGKKKLGILAWVPIANVLLFSHLAERTAGKRVRKGRLTTLLIFSMFAMLIFGGIFILTTVAILLYSFHCIAGRYSNKALVHTLIASVTFGMSVPISLFRFQKRQVAY